MSDENLFGDVIFCYSRKDAVRDGVLFDKIEVDGEMVDFTEVAKESGLRIYTVLSLGIIEYLTPTPALQVRGETFQSLLRSFFRDFIVMVQKQSAGGKSRIYFDLPSIKSRDEVVLGKKTLDQMSKADMVTVIAALEPNDPRIDPSPGLTFCFIEED